jgi:hypothetical protein
MRRMRVVCWVTNVTNTHSEYVIIVFLRQQRIRGRPSTVPHTYIETLVVTPYEKNIYYTVYVTFRFLSGYSTWYTYVFTAGL